MKKIIIFGTGEFGKNAFKYYSKNSFIKVLAFCDNNKDRYNQKLFNTKIISPEILTKTCFDYIYIASSFDNEIYKQLIDMNIKKEQIRILNISEVTPKLSHGNRLSLAEELMLFIAYLLNEYNIDYHIDHGTLLGIIRDNSLMPWDIDVDFACKSQDIDSVLNILNSNLIKFNSQYCQTNNWKYSLHNCYLSTEHFNKSLPMVIKIFNESKEEITNMFFLDIEFKYKYLNSIYWSIGSRVLKVEEKICFPSTSIKYKGKILNIAKCSEDYLTILYGDWKKVVKNWSYNEFDTKKKT